MLSTSFKTRRARGLPDEASISTRARRTLTKENSAATKKPLASTNRTSAKKLRAIICKRVAHTRPTSSCYFRERIIAASLLPTDAPMQGMKGNDEGGMMNDETKTIVCHSSRIIHHFFHQPAELDDAILGPEAIFLLVLVGDEADVTAVRRREQDDGRISRQARIAE